MERKGIIPQTQTRFRMGMGTIDNIFVLNYIINKRLRRKGGGMAVIFVEFAIRFGGYCKKKKNKGEFNKEGGGINRRD